MIVNVPFWKNPIDEYTKLLMHFDGPNNSTDFIDELGHTFTSSYSPVISTSQSKFGGASGYFPNSAIASTSGDYALGSGDFTVDFWVRPTVVQYNQVIVDMNTADSARNGPLIRLFNNNQISVIYVGSTDMNTSFALSINTWHHIALVRHGTDLRLYVNGTSINSRTNSANLTSNKITLGSLVGGNKFWFPGYIDEFRLSVGIARWTANFTPPTQPY